MKKYLSLAPIVLGLALIGAGCSSQPTTDTNTVPNPTPVTQTPPAQVPPTQTPPSTEPTTPAPTTYTYVSPDDTQAYVDAMTKFTNGDTKVDPSTTWSFSQHTTTTVDAAFPDASAAQAAATDFWMASGNTNNASDVVSFAVDNGTAYVLLRMDVDGWAGVSYAVNEVHPIVDKTLRLSPSITDVKFSPPPGKTINDVMQGMN